MNKRIIIAVFALLSSLFLSGKGKNEDMQRYFFMNTYHFNYNYETIHELFGPQSRQKLAVGNGILFYILNDSMDNFEKCLKKHFELAEKYDIPVTIKLDPLDFWGNVPEIWNWWDPSKPGYDPANRENVEWYGWGSENAVKIGWLNWGRQIRILPMMNLYSPEYQAEVKKRMHLFLTWISDWYKSLPKDRKYLLGSLVITGEFAFGVNNWYYPDGNSLLDKDESEDPQTGIDYHVMPNRGVAQTGYAALSYSGIRTEGEVTAKDIFLLEKKFSKFIADLCQGYGFGRDMLFNHAAGASDDLDSPVQDNTCPSWSFYWDEAVNPQDYDQIKKYLPRSDAPCWAASEWNFFKGGQDVWERALGNCFSIPGCKFVTIFNYDTIVSKDKDGNRVLNEGAINAIKKKQAEFMGL